MKFEKYMKNGKIVIQPAALTLCGLHGEDHLEMHTLDHALVLVKDELTRAQTTNTVMELMRLCNSLMVDVDTRAEDDPADEPYDGNDDHDPDNDVDSGLPIPFSVLEDAGLADDALQITSAEGIVTITRYDPDEHFPPNLEALLGKKHGGK
jgi:hypothetical protein